MFYPIMEQIKVAGDVGVLNEMLVIPFNQGDIRFSVLLHMFYPGQDVPSSAEQKQYLFLIF